MKNMKIEVTPQEIEAIKEKWIISQLEEAKPQDWDLKNRLTTEFLDKYREKFSYSNNYYLKDHFRKELREQLNEQVGDVIQKFITEELKKNLEVKVKQYLFENLNTIFQHVLGDVFIGSREQDAEWRAHEHQAIQEGMNAAYEQGAQDIMDGR